MRNFLVAVIKGFLFVTILTISSVAGLFKGIWEESDRLARLWMMQVGSGGKGASHSRWEWTGHCIGLFGFLLLFFRLLVSL